MTRASRWIAALAVCAACGGGDGAGDVDAGGSGDAGGPDAIAPPSGCPRTAAEANRARKVVVSHPYGDGGSQANTYEVLDLDTSGALTAPGVTFEMGRTLDQRIVFTPDGEVGVVAQDDGTLGIFSLAGATPQVIAADYDASGAFYATDVVMSADGARVYVLNGQWRENGGGIYAVDLDCDGQPTYAGLIAASKLPMALALIGGGRALVAADDIGDSTAGDTAHLIDVEGDGVLGGVDAFGDDDLIISDAAVTAAGDYMLIGDNNQYYDSAGKENKVAIVGIDGTTLTSLGVLAPIEDPYFLIASPYDDGAIVISGFGDAIFELDFDSGSSPPFSIAGELSYTGANPQLPGAAVMIDRGDLTGLVLVAENQGVRTVRFTGGGAVVDGGLTSWATGIPAIVGAVGVQP